MDRSDIVTLLQAVRTQNTFGVWEESYLPRTVYAHVDGVTRSEFYEGGRNGLNPEYRFTLFRGDYHGERVLEYHGQTYSVYRTYFARTDDIELYVERKGGSNDESTP